MFIAAIPMNIIIDEYISPGTEKSHDGLRRTGVAALEGTGTPVLYVPADTPGHDHALLSSAFRAGVARPQQWKSPMPFPRLLTTLLVSLAFAAPARAELTLASPLADHMVLQRDRPIPLWGTAAPHATVTLHLGPHAATTTATTTADATGRWTTTLPPLPFSSVPSTLEVTTGNEHLTRTDILLGDVFLCSGQSNMQMSLAEALGGEAAAARASSLPHLRLANIPAAWTDAPQTSAKISWSPATPASARDFSAVGYLFADELARDPALKDVPIGVIESCLGGTMIDAWLPKESLAPFAKEDQYDSMFGIHPTTLYNGMIAPLGTTQLKAVLWYQGEGNAGHPENYAPKLTALFSGWRRQFNDPNLPFIVIGLPDYLPNWGGQYWQWLREAQANAVAATPHTSLALAINTTDGTDLHPKEKREIAHRAALLARHDLYHEPIESQGPLFKSAAIEGHHIRLTFTTDTPLTADALVTDPATPPATPPTTPPTTPPATPPTTPPTTRPTQGEPPLGFTLAGEDGRFFYADAKIENNTVLLSSPYVRAPRYARYAWSGVPRSTLTNASHLPAAPFRTDTLPPDNIALEPSVVTPPPPGDRHLITPTYDLTLTPQGHITSLVFKGKQLLSNDPGNNGGAVLPTFFGPRNLPHLTQQGPGTLTLADDTLSLTLAATESTLTLILKNTSKDNADFRLNLNPLVKTESTADKTVKLTRKDATATATGIDTIDPSDDGPKLKTTLPGNTTRTITITFAP